MHVWVFIKINDLNSPESITLSNGLKSHCLFLYTIHVGVFSFNLDIVNHQSQFSFSETEEVLSCPNAKEPLG